MPFTRPSTLVDPKTSLSFNGQDVRRARPSNWPLHHYLRRVFISQLNVWRGKGLNLHFWRPTGVSKDKGWMDVSFKCLFKAYEFLCNPKITKLLVCYDIIEIIKRFVFIDITTIPCGKIFNNFFWQLWICYYKI